MLRYKARLRPATNVSDWIAVSQSRNQGVVLRKNTYRAALWVTRTSNFGTTNIWSVAYGNGLWVAGGDFGNIRSSTNGITWVTRISNIPAINSVAYGNGLWVAGGGAGYLSTSADAITWTTRNVGFGSTYLWSFSYGGGKWLAVGDSGQMRISTDGFTWTSVTSGFGTNTIRAAHYANNLWIAVGENGRLNTSTDAITWISRTSNFGTNLINDVYYGPRLWVAVGQSGQARTSTNGITWTTTQLGTSDFMTSVFYNSGVWIAGGLYGQIRASTDTVTWTSQNSNFGSTIINSVFGNDGLWVAVGNTGQIRTSQQSATVISEYVKVFKNDNLILQGDWYEKTGFLLPTPDSGPSLVRVGATAATGGARQDAFIRKLTVNGTVIYDASLSVQPFTYQLNGFAQLAGNSNGILMSSVSAGFTRSSVWWHEKFTYPVELVAETYISGDADGLCLAIMDADLPTNLLGEEGGNVGMPAGYKISYIIQDQWNNSQPTPYIGFGDSRIGSAAQFPSAYVNDVINDGAWREIKIIWSGPS